MRRSLESRFVEFIQRRGLISLGDRILVAVSGGVDSMVLLDLFRNAGAQLGITVTAAHFDHAMRPGSAADAEWLAGVCRAWSVPLIRERARAALYGEAAARAARYAFLAAAAQQSKADRIATAHHADDQIETVLFRMLRGTGLRGLSGIPVRRGKIIRPLLRFRKSQLEAYARTHRIPFREDETNASNAYARNRIRRALIPVLKTVRPDSPSAILQLARHAARAEKRWRLLLDDVVHQVIVQRNITTTELARGKLLEYDAEVQARLLRTELRRFGVVPTHQATERLLRFVNQAESGNRSDIGKHVRIERAYDLIRITRPAATSEQRAIRIASCTDGRARARIGEKEFDVVWSTRAPMRGDAERFDCAQLSFPLELRTWRPGDRMRLAYGTKKLKKLFAEARVPIHERSSVPVLVDANGLVCWAVGVARSVHAPANEEDLALTIMVSHV